MRYPDFRHLTAGLLAAVSFCPALFAFNPSGARWPSGTVTMHLQLGPTNGPLADGAPSWGTVAEDALANWNRNVTNLRFEVVRDSPVPVNRNNGVNNVIFSSTVYGEAWGGRVVGITLQLIDERSRRYLETDVIFNSTVRWDSYRGATRTLPSGESIHDFRRIAIHEFGHALGLNHPDEIGQTVPAVMNTFASDIDAPTADDIAGVRAIYDNPATATSILSIPGASSFSAVGNSLTWRIGAVRNAGEATSGALRFELWATPQPFASRLPAGSYLLGTYTLDAPLAPQTTVSDLTATTPLAPAPDGSYYLVMMLTESTGGANANFAMRDFLAFPSFYNVGPPSAPVITSQPATQSGSAGATAAFSVLATGTLPLTYQWRKDGVDLPGATTATLTLTRLSSTSAGAYTVAVGNSLGSTTSAPAKLILADLANPGRLVNMSIRTNAGTGDNTLIVGVGLGGGGTTGPKAVLFRGVGPTLGAFGVGSALADTVMTLFQNGAQVAQNDDWGGGFDFGSVGAFGFSGSPPRDSGYYNSALPSGSYSIQILGKGNTTGVALAEIYDATPPSSYTRTTPRLVNVSARTHVGTGDNILIAGFVVGGTTAVRVLVRAVGPTLGAFGVSGTLVDPRLEILRGTTAVASNDNWLATDAAVFGPVGAFPLNANSRDAAVVTTLAPDSYTVQISGVGGTTGVALVEVYELP